MDMFDGELSHATITMQRMRRQAKKKNEAFRRRLDEKKAENREVTHLKLATAAAAMSWALVGIQLIR
jgi:hypothetical protein